MPLFRGHVLRSTIIAGLLVFAAHHAIKRMPESMHVFTLTQTSIAIIALASLMLLVAANHRRQGQVLTQTQEELLLLVAFGLFWLSAFVAYRAFGQRRHTDGDGLHPPYPAMTPPRTGGMERQDGLNPQRQQRPPQRVGTQTERPGENPGWPCSGDAFRCVVEEWTYY
ncbi:hypothetical protein DFH11DRAFT_659735 [Phellopilus nigrolimitatus]|nr:hypothetical protein DFH11DRAFT_659735 [Phellopilus nigrolimitatus]